MKNLAKAAMAAGAAVVLSLGALSVPGVARAGVAISIDVAPPPPRVEVLPPPRVGYCGRRGIGNGSAGTMPGLVAFGCRPVLAMCITGPEWRQRHGHWVYYEERWGRH